MFSKINQRILTVLLLTGTLLIGATAAEARDTRDTKGADRLVKGAIIGAVVGGVTQHVRGRTEGRELLKGAAVGGAVGAAVGGYSDYRQERDARYDAERRADYYEHRSHRDSRPVYDRYDRSGRYDRYDDGRYYQNNRGRKGGQHRHNARCNHR